MAVVPEADALHRRQDAAREWAALSGEAGAQADTAAAPPARHQVVAWWRHQRAVRAASRRRPELVQAHRSMRHRLERLAVGARPGEWGVLATAHSRERRVAAVSLESTLRRLLATQNAATEPVVGSAVASLLDGLPAVRALTELGRDPHAVGRVEDAVLALADTPSLDRAWRRTLLEHLSAARRPLPATVAGLERSGPPVKLWVSEEARPPGRGERGWVRLHDIGVTPGLKGNGLGTAALAELCGYADQRGLVVVGELIPSRGATEDDLRRLAGWYARHGFIQGDRPPAEWPRGGGIRREPQAPSDAA